MKCGFSFVCLASWFFGCLHFDYGSHHTLEKFLSLLRFKNRIVPAFGATFSLALSVPSSSVSGGVFSSKVGE